MGAILGVLFKQLVRDSRHVKEQKEGRQLIAERLGIPGPWQPEMVNYPSFVCAHCHFPHILRQTMVGCSACAAPYFTAEIMSSSKKGRLTCAACTVEQDIAAMPFCCTNCRCIQGVPSQLDWRKNYTRLPAWRPLVGPLITVIFGLLVILGCFVGSKVNGTSHADDLTVLGILFGGIPLVVGALFLIGQLLRKKIASEMMLSCGGFGIRTPTGEEKWFSWQDVRGIHITQPMNRRSLIVDTNSAVQPDSIAETWTIHTARETVFFDNRLQHARELARQIRMRAPAAPVVDLPPMEYSNPWIAILLALFIVLIGFLVSMASQRWGK